MGRLINYRSHLSRNGATTQRNGLINNRHRIFLCMIGFVLLTVTSYTQNPIRTDISLSAGWQTIALDENHPGANDDVMPDPNIDGWKRVNVPHNWDAYDGYRRLLHGNKHGNAWYRKTFAIKQNSNRKRFFLFFEGVGSYATVYLNGKYVGEHAGGRTTFTIDVTDAIKTDGSNNNLSVRAYHPSNIKDLPWVCGGCSNDRGFSEGSQPMGIFRPVHLISTADIRIVPFGIHAWSDSRDDVFFLSVNTTLKNYSTQNRNIVITNQLVDTKGKIVAETFSTQVVKPQDSIVVQQRNIRAGKPSLWSTKNPYLYKIVTLVKENNTIIDKTETVFGFRTINWQNPTHQFILNGEPVFINGIAEYEHLIGQSHAFSKEQVIARMKWIQAAGFNAFRDAHQPHNLLYGQLCNEKGILWWTQLSAHVWYDTKEFRDNFKQLVKDWVIERRNDPSVILWGLQNESKLPEDFAKECTELIRSLDPTASTQRLVTTCNGGTGTDWDVPQNWTGTYGGDPNTYASDVKKQVLIGEYGAWRTIDLHTEGPFVQNGVLSENRMTQLMEQKLRLAESVKDSSAGQFFWLLNSHDNPGRVQGGEGLRELDRVGPVNYKGLLTPWEEPTDAFYMFRSNYAPKDKEPMVYIVSHTWPNRWTKPGIKDSIIVYSNCDEVELFNDMYKTSLGKRKRNGPGTHFQWDHVPIKYNILYAVGYINGKAVMSDVVILNNLPVSPNFKELNTTHNSIRPLPGYNYIYRINCGGPDFTDGNGNLWQADRALKNTSNKKPDPGPGSEINWGSFSWTKDFPGLPAFFASQRRTFSPIKGTIAEDWKLLQDFRYGKDKLQYEFPLPDGEYLVELYFIEPWIGVGGGVNGTGMRLFDVAINGKTVLQNMDIWKEVSTNALIKKSVKAKISGGKMIISFPQTKSGQAIISAIAIASLNKAVKPAAPHSIITDLSNKYCHVSAWLDAGDQQYGDTSIVFYTIPPNLYGAEWLQFAKKEPAATTSFRLTEDADVFIGSDKDALQLPAWLKEYENTATIAITSEADGKTYTIYRKRFLKGAMVTLPVDNSFLVMVLPVTNMQPAYDLKPVTSYRTNVAIVADGVQKEMLTGRECAVVKSKSAVNIQWPVQTGVADIYSITVKYYYSSEKDLPGRIQLIGAGGAMMLDETVNFTFTRSGKWNQFTINTGNMINAGNYSVKLITENAEGLAVSGIEVQ